MYHCFLTALWEQKHKDKQYLHMMVSKVNKKCMFGKTKQKGRIQKSVEYKKNCIISQKLNHMLHVTLWKLDHLKSLELIELQFCPCEMKIKAGIHKHLPHARNYFQLFKCIELQNPDNSPGGDITYSLFIDDEVMVRKWENCPKSPSSWAWNETWIYEVLLQSSAHTCECFYAVTREIIKRKELCNLFCHIKYIIIIKMLMIFLFLVWELSF